jgi:hypothetical protein
VLERDFGARIVGELALGLVQRVLAGLGIIVHGRHALAPSGGFCGVHGRRGTTHLCAPCVRYVSASATTVCGVNGGVPAVRSIAS